MRDAKTQQHEIIWVTDMGAGAGDEGGQVVGFGQPEEIADLEQSKTASFLKRKLGERISV